MVTINRYIKALLHPAGGHQGSHKAHQAGCNYLSMLEFKLNHVSKGGPGELCNYTK